MAYDGDELGRILDRDKDLVDDLTETSRHRGVCYDDRDERGESKRTRTTRVVRATNTCR